MPHFNLNIRAAVAMLVALESGVSVTGFAQTSGDSTTRVRSATPAFTVTRTGRGRPMILIPGLLSSGEVWNGAVEHYRDRYDMHVLTLAGFAGAAPLNADKYLEAERDAIIRYIRDNRLEKPVLVGHSLGAFLALWVAAKAPDLVGPIVAVDGVPFLPALSDTTATPAKSMAQAAQLNAMAAGLTKDQLAMQTAMALRAQSRDTANALLGARWGRASDGATMGRAMSEALTTDLRAEVAAIRTPVLLIASGFDVPETQRGRVLASYASQVARVPVHRVVMATNARHFVMLDDPAYLYAMIDELLTAR